MYIKRERERDAIIVVILSRAAPDRELFASREFDIFVCAIRVCVWKCCGESRRFAESFILPVKWPTCIADICGDDSSARKVHRIMAESWCVKAPDGQ